MAESEANKNRPEDSDFKQQRLKAWQPILTPAWVIGTFLSVGMVFLAIGIAVLVTSNSISEQSSQDYVDIGPNSWSDGGTGNCIQGADTYGGSCLKNVNVTLDEDMDSPVYLYFELTEFYQNHRRYVKSRNDDQLMSNSDATTTDQCSPIDKVDSGNSNNELAIYPCGLIAWSAFNDTLYAANQISTNVYEYYQNYLLRNTDGSGSCSSSSNCDFIPTTKNGIAWSSDKDDKFEKLDSCSGNGLFSSVTSSLTMPYNTFKYYMCSTSATYTSTCSIGSSTASSNSCFDHTTTSTPTYGSTTGTNSQQTCEQKYRCGDVSNEEFIVWMRTSGLPTFRKLYRVINTDLKKGDILLFTINDVFPTSAFSGSKRIVLSTTAWIGGKNTFLGAAYITVACICILLGLSLIHI
eukprot:TRINITY_DN12569_c0_g1_i4.p1 TRINITY_DN12569_c0_g1~~TRINITY_DN12569_c0_g1_i4.p1  ORF type:complete len:407 (-),score=108.70 TRINITY_DN12569_c0_g1_i4:183-1403(-)